MKNDMYDVNEYTEKELYDILDMNSPTDRELEAKIIFLINKYENMQNESGNKLTKFFSDIYAHFFDVKEGFDDQQQEEQEPQEEPQEPQAEAEDQEIAHVQQFDFSQDNLRLNPLLKQTIQRIISIDSQFRDIKTHPQTTSFSFDLSEPLRDVVSLRLYSVQIPYTWYTIPKSYGSNFFYLKGNASGITNGNFDYKIAIPPGNYTPAELESTINTRFNDISNNPPTQILSDIPDVISASDVNFNGKKFVTYDSNTSKMTFTIDLQNTFSESYYRLYFPDWTAPSQDTTTLSGYMGFNEQSYSPATITSYQQYITTQTVTTETTADYVVDELNNYFDVQVYANDDYTYNIDKTPLYTFRVELQTTNGEILKAERISRTDIISSLQRGIQNNPFLDSASKIERIDFSNNHIHSNYSAYRLTIVLDRYYTKYLPNTKVVVQFPDEPIRTLPGTSDKSKVWLYDPTLNHNCFFFEYVENKFSNFISESPAVYSSYVVDNSTNMIFTCVITDYDTGVNDFSLNIPSNITPGYTLNGYLSAITTTMSNYNTNNILFNMTSAPGEPPKGAFIDTNARFNLSVDFTKTFNTPLYDISFDDTSLLGRMGTYNVGAPWIENEHLSDQTVFTHSVTSSGSGYFVDASYILTITPNQIIADSGHQSAQPFDVYLLPQYQKSGEGWSVDGNGNIIFSYIEDYIEAINSSIKQATLTQASINDVQRPLSQSGFTGVFNSGTNYYDLTLTINYLYVLTEAFYDISFASASDPSSWSVFDISESYNLNDQSVGSYSQITGNTEVEGDQITLTETNNKLIIQTTAGNSEYNIPEDAITLTIPQGQYTINTLYNTIQSLFDSNAKLYGSQISGLQQNNRLYTEVKLNVNNIFTSKDYKLVFYDPVSFVRCFVGSRSVKNTTWDSTLGWILGFRDYTEYELIQSNVVYDGEESYYLTSLNGNYIYKELTNNVSGLLTNTQIKLTGDTTVSTNLYNYFLISLDDFIQNRLNDGLVTITRKDTRLEMPGYSNRTTQICDPATNTLVNAPIQQQNSTNVTNNQLFSVNQSAYSEQNVAKPYSSGPFIKDLFGLIPIKVPSKNGDYYIEFGGSLQSQERLYFGPVNIRKMSIQLMNDRGDVIDLNNSNWSFSFVCEQMYRSSDS